jgi:hypothetical protein
VDGYEQEAHQGAGTVMRVPEPPAAAVGEKVPPSPPSTTGVAEPSVITPYVSEVYAYWKNKGNGKKPLMDLSKFLVEEVNDWLMPPQGHPVIAKFVTSGDAAGAFKKEDWWISINTAKFSEREGVSKIEDLTQDEVAKIVETFSHEARHAEQAFRVARMMAGQKETATPKQQEDVAKKIEEKMKIPSGVAGEAVKSPLKGSSASTTVLIAEAKRWAKYICGKYQIYRKEVLTLALEMREARRALIAWDAARPGHAESQFMDFLRKLKPVRTRIDGFFHQQKEFILRIQPSKRDIFDKDTLARTETILLTFEKMDKLVDAMEYPYSDAQHKELIDLFNDTSKATDAAYRTTPVEADALQVGAATQKAFMEQKEPRE